MIIRTVPWLIAFALLGGCAASGPASESDKQVPDTAGWSAEPIFDANRVLYESWTAIDIRGQGAWSILLEPDGLSIFGEAKDSATGLAIETAVDPVTCPVLEWSWLVETVQPSADLTERDTDDVAAALYVFFGDPGRFSAPNPVPVLRYVWTGGPHRIGEIIPNPYLPDLVRNVVIRTPDDLIGEWQTEQRDLLADYEAAFGSPPDEFVLAVAVFIDNDQTGEPAAARFRHAAALCP